MKPEDYSELSGGEICDILKACKDAGVSELKIGEIHVLFGQNASRLESRAYNGATIPEIVHLQDQEAEKGLLTEELNLKEDQLQELWLTDPEKAEELELTGEIEDDDAEEEAYSF